MRANLAALTAEMILGIPETEPERLFSNDEDEATKESRKLVSRWHPDRCTDSRATEVMQWVQKLFASAEQKREAGTWETPGVRYIRAADGSEFKLQFSRKLDVDIGTLFVGKSVLAFEIPAANVDLAERAEELLSSLTYAHAAMREEFARYFPELLRRIDTPTGTVLVIKKTPDLLLLQDVLTHFQGKVPAVHVAWIISRLLNIACYLERQGKVAHNGIGLDSIFISPQYHSVALLGGWWFATKLGEPMVAASRRAALYAPPDVLQAKLGDSRTDLELIKAVGRELLGDATGVRLASDAAVPQAMANWLQLSSSQGPVAAFKEWQERVLVDAFGQRKFVELELTHDNLYSN